MFAKKSGELGFIHNFIPANGSDSRTLLLLHGTGANEDDLLTIGQILDDKAGIIAPRGKVLENGMPRYFKRLAPGVFDIEDLKLRTDELAGFIDLSSKKYGFDLGSLVLVGYSNGANIGASLLLLKPGLLKRAILFRAMIPIEPFETPQSKGLKVFISGGQYDSMIPKDKTIELKEILQRSGAEVMMNWEASTHSLTINEIKKAREWLFSNSRN